jgi:lysozyme
MGAEVKITPQGVLEIAEHEGIVLGPYKDSVGIWTYGVGHTKAAGGLNPEKMPKVDTRLWGEQRVQEELVRAVQVFDADLDTYEDRVRRAIKVPLKPHQFDALVSFDFNTGGILRAKLTEAINAKAPDASRHFFGWLRPPELRKRREAEEALFRTGSYDANGDRIAVWDALGDGRLRHRMTISGKDLARLMERAGTARRAPTAPVPAPEAGGWLAALRRALAAMFGRKA